MTDDGSRWHRLHPIALVVSLIDSVKDGVALILAMAAIALAKRDSPAVVAAALAIIVLLAAWMLAAPLARWRTTSYLLDEDGVTLRSGVFNRKRVTIAYDHIHTVSSSMPFYMRPFGVVTLQVTAAGSAEAGITLAAVPASLQTELEALRQRIGGAATAAGDPAGGISETATSVAGGSAPDDSVIASAIANAGTSHDASSDARAGAVSNTRHRVAPSSAVPEPAAGTDAVAPPSAPIQGELVFRASTRDILLFAVTDLGMFAALLALIGIVNKARDVVPGEWMDALGDTIVRTAMSGVLAAAALAVGVAAALAAVSVAGALLRFHGFEVWRRGGDLVVVRGAFTRRVTTIAVDRIRTVTIRRSLLRRMFHLCSVRLGLGASDNDDDGDASGADVLPVISDGRVYAVMGRMLPEWQLQPPRIHRTGRGLLRYFLLVPMAATAIGCATVLAWSAVEGDPVLLWWLFAPASIGAFWMGCRWLKSHAEGYALLDDRRIAASGASVLTMVTLFTGRSRIQSVERSTTMWRAAHGVESMSMPLYVTNGSDSLRFTALRSSDADRLAVWSEQGA